MKGLPSRMLHIAAERRETSARSAERDACVTLPPPPPAPPCRRAPFRDCVVDRLERREADVREGWEGLDRGDKRRHLHAGLDCASGLLEQPAVLRTERVGAGQLVGVAELGARPGNHISA